MSHRFLDEFKGYMGYDTGDVTKDESISLCLEASEDYLVSNFNIMCLEQSLTYTADGDGGDYLYLPYRINTITSITLDGVVLDSNTYVFRQNKIRLKEGSFTSGFDNLIVVYTAGYLDESLPPSLKSAMFKLAEKLFKDADESRDGIGGFNTNTKTGTDFVQLHLPNTFYNLIAPYRLLRL